jgi:hypothetical protein
MIRLRLDGDDAGGQIVVGGILLQAEAPGVERLVPMAKFQ